MSNEEIAVKVEGVYKDFKLPHEKVNSLKSLITNAHKKKDKGYETQHALKDISFEIKKGEFFGIVGRNGSGKSTLLKIISEIYRPTKGRVIKHGKLVPFIELGVGFNPELTGRENVFLNGALLGFTQDEMEAMYDDIVEFAELEKFMDQKLKNYSSGMQVRLAFSVAIKAGGDVLVFDEVLAVGDEAFQRKCDDYFKTVKKDKTKTVILVTHSMDAVRRFCDRALLIDNGVMKAIGSTEDIANQYTLENFATARSKKTAGKYEEGLSERIPYFKVTTPIKSVISSKDDLVFDIEYEITDNTPVHIHFAIIDEIRNTNILNNGAKAISGKGRHKLRYVLPLNIYNDCNLQVHAVLDEERTRKRIAFTNAINSCRVAVRNKISNKGLISTTSNVRGYWENWEDFTYNRELEES